MHRTTRLIQSIRALFISMLFLLPACDDEPVPEADVQLQAFAESYCAKMFSCCTPTEVYATEAECVAQFVDRNTINPHLFQSYDNARLRTCLRKKWSEISGGCDQAMDFRLEECLNLIQGELKADELYCADSLDCPESQFCKSRGDYSECSPRAAAEASCDDAPCVRGLVCRPRTFPSVFQYCLAPLPLGETCTTAIQCGSQYDLTVTCIDGTCARLIPDGDSCVASECTSGYCHPDDHLCAPLTLRHFCENLRIYEKMTEESFTEAYSWR
ncbi:hypothetical protein KKD52_16780 [Myxococcota bacterium]|nr:hypothetical protein [Myxococcota bacterium]MBU1410662.1 hypothetical protein [Myxococcota bacterium]MBU1512011.1 hypothetical protein [Myxococcota bacterium]